MTYEYITEHDSPNFTPAAESRSVFGRDRQIKSITIHHWGVLGQKFENVIGWFLNPAAGTSAHYVVEAGKVACIVDPDDVAWHAGSGEGNTTSIGIELRPEATDADYATAAELVADLRDTYGDLPLVAHSSWRATACPGKWDLTRLDALARGEKPSYSKSSTVTVKAGEGLWQVWNTSARPNGLTFAQFLGLNGLNVWSMIHPGDTLKVGGKVSTTPLPIPGVAGGYTSSAATHNGRRVEYHTFKGGLTKPSGVVVYLHGDNKPSETATPGGSQVARMAAAAHAANHVFVLAISPSPSWYFNYEASAEDPYRHLRTAGSQTQALRTFLPAVINEVGVPSGGHVLVVGHSGGAEAITLHLARTDVSWAAPYNVDFTMIGGGTPNGLLKIDTPTSFRSKAYMLFAGSSAGDGVGATKADGGKWSAWASAQKGEVAYEQAGHVARLWDTGAPGHNSYDFGAIIQQSLKEAK